MFSGGVSWNREQIQQMLVDQQAYFNLGDGNVTLSQGRAVVQMGSGITPDDILLQANNAGDLTVRLRNSNDTLTLNNDFSIQGWGVSSILQKLAFSDGTVLEIGQP